MPKAMADTSPARPGQAPACLAGRGIESAAGEDAGGQRANNPITSIDQRRRADVPVPGTAHDALLFRHVMRQSRGISQHITAGCSCVVPHRAAGPGCAECAWVTASPDGVAFVSIEGQPGARKPPARSPSIPSAHRTLTGRSWPLADVRLLAPILASKVVCNGQELRRVHQGDGWQAPEDPVIFLKPNTRDHRP